MDHRAALRWLFGLQGLGVKLGLDNIRRLLADLGHPERACPSVLVTGTNGKGSVAAMLTAALAETGLRVGTYVSPHLVRFEERIAVDRAAIAPRRTAALATEVRTSIERLLAKKGLERHPTFFEVVTAMAFLEFRQREVAIAVLEVGLGGRFDATNAASPTVSVVTTVALEHMRWLGNTVEAIAFEKAGVGRSGRPLVTGLSKGPAHRALEKRAKALGARLRSAPRVARTHVVAATRRGLTLDVETLRGTYPRIHLPLAGRHQALNASVAVAALEALPVEIRPSPAKIAAGLARTRWPGRIEYVNAGHEPLLLDGAHNPHAAQALAEYLAEFEARRRRVLVFACLADKDVAGIVGPLFPLFHDVVLTRVANPRALDPAALKLAAPASVRVVEEPRLARALAAARRLAGERGLVVVTGSLYLVGAVKAALGGARPPDQG